MLKKTFVIVSAVLIAPTVASLVIGGWIEIQEMRYKLMADKLDRQIAAK